ncbi:hypothetical protein AAFC00_001261 [Neodothiora populina]|uniref:Peptidase M20 dimerisation domain-containing protein n=1 Tax=Neodothiora populina TaxID=2781224 RepID=A0ABR3PNN7_9PEZI
MAWHENLAWHRLLLFMVVVFGLLTAVSTVFKHYKPLNLESQDSLLKEPEWCAIPEPLIAADDGMAISESFVNETFLAQQVERLSAAVKVATISYNDNGDPDADARWSSFKELHDVLRSKFPKVHEKTELEKVNTFGLLYTLKGSSPDLQPIIFMAHQDVVPVTDPSTWTHPPFDGHYDGRWLWGRGSVDCKNNLVGLLSALEELLQQGFLNKRTIMLSFGYDEETGGQRGAKSLAAHIEKIYGSQSVAMILDEGGMGIEQINDIAYARPGVAEKGFVDLVLQLQMTGGHSSAPPPHTAIGVMSLFIQELEENPMPPNLDLNNPFRNYLECQAQYSPGSVESWLPKELRSGKDLAERLIDSRGDTVRWAFQTSQSVDVISGGVADNVVPESVEVVVNYRVLPTDNTDNMFRTIADFLAPIAHDFKVGVNGFGYTDIDTGNGVLNITTKDELPPSPITPTGSDIPYWRVFAGTIRSVFEKRDPTVTMVVPVGDIMTGNTDTVHYWNLSRNIYRFSPRWSGTTKGVHTVDERIDMRAHVEAVRLYYDLMRNLQLVED